MYSFDRSSTDGKLKTSRANLKRLIGGLLCKTTGLHREFLGLLKA
jgi:hypothetical protein